MTTVDDIKRWTCHACGTRVASNSTGQVRDETGSHHNPGGDRCIRVMQDTADKLRADVERARVEERARIVALLRTWERNVHRGREAAPAAGDTTVIKTLHAASVSIELDEQDPSWAR